MSDAARAALDAYVPLRLLGARFGRQNKSLEWVVVIAGLRDQALAGLGQVPEFRVVVANAEADLEVWLREIEPTVTQSFSQRLDLWAARAARLLAQRLNETL
ncbi:MAG: hypothetical protein LBE08_09590 [Bifidobacteriaceae bacterium]|jgi:hypothetical protein|nr:hypothetical protein [Bifidobacteriaceae bacterium]